MPRIFNRGLKPIFNDLKDILSDWSSSNAGDNGRGIGWIVLTSEGGFELNELNDMLLLAERRLGVFGNGGDWSRKRLSRYAGLFPAVDGRTIAAAILCLVV